MRMGRPRWSLGRGASPGPGQPAQVLEANRDVTEWKRVEQTLRENEERFRSAFEHTGGGMVLTDLNHRFVRVNAAFARLFGYPAAEMLRLSMIDVTYPDDLAGNYERREGLESGAVDFFQMEKRYLHKDGHVFWGLANAPPRHPGRYRAEQVVGVAGLGRRLPAPGRSRAVCSAGS
jgi:two-component system, cell cycle sensor histidine kinase and response regulator CckA